MYKYLGATVICKGYLHKIQDGIHIECFDNDGIDCNISYKDIVSAYVVRHDKRIKDIQFEGDGSEKTLYRLVDKSFYGFCVGEKSIVTKEFLYGDIGYNLDYSDYKYISKQHIEKIDCYIVYYANNKKRYVPKTLCSFI